MVDKYKYPVMGSPLTGIIILICTMMLVFITVATVRINLEPMTNIKLSNIGYENQHRLNYIISEQKKMQSLIEDLNAKIDKLNLK